MPPSYPWHSAATTKAFLLVELTRHFPDFSSGLARIACFVHFLLYEAWSLPRAQAFCDIDSLFLCFLSCGDLAKVETKRKRFYLRSPGHDLGSADTCVLSASNLGFGVLERDFMI
jgi:hypothetical protein